MVMSSVSSNYTFSPEPPASLGLAPYFVFNHGNESRHATKSLRLTSLPPMRSWCDRAGGRPPSDGPPTRTDDQTIASGGRLQWLQSRRVNNQYGVFITQRLWVMIASQNARVCEMPSDGSGRYLRPGGLPRQGGSGNT